MKEKNEKNLDRELVNIILEKPKGFDVKGTHYNIYPLSLGRAMLISQFLESIGLNESNSQAMFSVLFKDYKKSKCHICRLIAYHTLGTREEVLNADVLNNRTKELETMTDTEMAAIIYSIYNEIPVSDLFAHLGIDSDRRLLMRIQKLKEKTNKNNPSFGGHSLLGTLIAPACEKFNLTPREVVWEISYRFLQMLLADAPTSAYLTDDEMKKLHIVSDRKRIDMDKKGSEEIINSMDWS